MRGG
jgi:hypothetical protein